MCSFIVSNFDLDDLDFVNFFTSKRGPDLTNKEEIHGFYYVQNLLSITGTFAAQPFVDEAAKVVSVFNGEIYNYNHFLGNAESDGYCINPAYHDKGISFIKELEGEFAIVIVDQKKKRIIASTDTFATKPLWVGRRGDKICFTTYESVLKRLKIKRRFKLKANTTYIFNIDSLEIEQTYTVRSFDIHHQHKDHYNDWISAFEVSIRKRSHHLKERMFIGLSSGYDSGAIACELNKQGVAFNTYSIVADENSRILNQRIELLSSSGIATEKIYLTYSEYDEAKDYIKANAEEFAYQIQRDGEITPNEWMTEDQGAVGLAHISDKAKKADIKIYLSGQGADEILSDYGFAGERYFEHSTFGGKFPTNLAEVFPWNNFYESTQLSYLAKEEAVSGAFGIEGRYPFLDADLVQEFLWLHPDLKNKHYKAPLHEYLIRNDFPFQVNQKIGFGADKVLR